MDRQFLEFWGNFFLTAAKGQKQMEDMARWIEQGIGAAGFEDLAAMFTRAYGLNDPGADNTPDAGMWEAAARQFNHSFKEYMALMGMVSNEEHLRLQEKCEALEKKCADREETIAHLRELLGAVGKAGQEEVVKSFQAILEKQTTQFQDLVSSSTRFLKEAAPPPKQAKKAR